MTGKRAARAAEFIGKATWAASALSFDLVVSAQGLLEQALNDRRGRVFRLPRTHYTPRAVGAIALVVTAFEAFLNEAYDVSSPQLPWARERAVEASLMDKATGLFHVATPPGATFDTGELEMVIDVRNEIIHYLPRPTPDLIERLEKRGLLMAAQGANWDMGQKLGSYALAHWAFATIEATIGRLAQVTPRERWLSTSLAENFTLHPQRFCPPDRLPDFDQQHGLTLTDVG